MSKHTLTTILIVSGVAFGAYYVLKKSKAASGATGTSGTSGTNTNNTTAGQVSQWGNTIKGLFGDISSIFGTSTPQTNAGSGPAAGSTSASGSLTDILSGLI